MLFVNSAHMLKCIRYQSKRQKRGKEACQAVSKKQLKLLCEKIIHFKAKRNHKSHHQKYMKRICSEEAAYKKRYKIF